MQNYSIVDIGKELQKYGLRVGENPAFGTVGKHAPDSYHYEGQAIDVTDWRPDVAPSYEGGQPLPWKQRTGQLSWRAKQSGLFTEALGPGDKGHDTHIHLAADKPISTTPEMLQWIATGRYKTPEGKLTDVMPSVGAVGQQTPTTTPSPPAQQQSTQLGDTYIFVNKRPQRGSDFLSSYLQTQLNPEVSPITSGINPVALLMQAINQTPDYLS